MLKSSSQALLMVMMSRGCESQKIPRIYFDSAEETPEAEERLAHDISASAGSANKLNRIYLFTSPISKSLNSWCR